MKQVSALLVVFLALAGLRALGSGRIINGVEVPAGEFLEVVNVDVDRGAHCTGTLVGPRVVLTAAHCGTELAEAEVEIDGKSRTGTFFRHKSYPAKDIDIGLVLLREEVNDVRPAIIDRTLLLGQEVFLLGYGCNQVGGGGATKLRMGTSIVVNLDGTDFVSRRPDGGAFCFGDSGGPTMSRSRGRYYVVGVASKGNLKDTNYSVQLGKEEAMGFLLEMAKAHAVQICGVNAICGIEPIGAAPEFQKDAYYYTMKNTTALTEFLPRLLKEPLQDAQWKLGANAPEWVTLEREFLRAIPPAGATGQFSFTLEVSTAVGGDTATIGLNLVGESVAPSCTLVATPQFITLGQSLELLLETKGDVAHAAIDGKAVSTGSGKITLKPAAAGVFVARAVVTSPGGDKAECSARYAVK